MKRRPSHSIIPFIHLLINLLFFSQIVYSQDNIGKNTVRGKIIDINTKAPLENVNVFFDNTTIGDVSDKNGNYEIRNISHGSYILVISMVGYEVEKTTIELFNQKEIEKNFQLKAKIYQLQSLEITGETPKNWKKDL